MKVNADSYFAMVPEWLLDADVTDRAIHVYARLGRFADKQGSAHPSRGTLAELCRCSVKSIDRALNELEDIGAIAVVKRFHSDGERGQNSNRYLLRRERPKGLPATVVSIPARGRHQ